MGNLDKEVSVEEARISSLEMDCAGKDMVIEQMQQCAIALIRHLANLELHYPGTHNLDKTHPIWKSIDEMYFWVKDKMDEELTR